MNQTNSLSILLKNQLKAVLPEAVIAILRDTKNFLLLRTKSARLNSLRRAVKEQKLLSLYNRLSEIIPDLSDQYSFVTLGDYHIQKVRSLHAFQISLIDRAFQLIETNFGVSENLNIVDIGDSSGAHSLYLKEIYNQQKNRYISVNLDTNSIDKIRSRGLEAINARAEDIAENLSIDIDLFLSFEMLEHLLSPVSFLWGLSQKTTCKYFVLSVPYLKNSRVALEHIRKNQKGVPLHTERVHVFELSPSDWKMIFLQTGWSVEYEECFLQYPSKGLYRLTKNYWKRFDFEGFYGAILKRDSTWSDLYKDW